MLILALELEHRVCQVNSGRAVFLEGEGIPNDPVIAAEIFCTTGCLSSSHVRNLTILFMLNYLYFKLGDAN